MGLSGLDSYILKFCYFSGLSSAQLSVIKNEYQASSFPGLDIPMNQVQWPWLSRVEILYMIKSSVGEMSPHGRFGEIWRKICHVEKFLHMRDVETNLFCHNSCCFVVKSVLLPYTLFCCERYFVAIYALLCGEKFNQKLCLWRKKDKYQVCVQLWSLRDQRAGASSLISHISCYHACLIFVNAN